MPTEAPSASAVAPSRDILHVVGAGEDRGVPFLMVHPAAASHEGAAAPTVLPLSGRFAWTVSGTRTCIGRWQGGSHLPCPTQAVVAADFVCRACSGVEVPECVFEPQCENDPSSCKCSFGPVPHVVYVAFYGPLAKVGLTQEWRVATRLREQGADAYFVAVHCNDRGTARAVERSVGFLYGIPEFRMPREILPQLARPVDWNLVVARAAALGERLAPRFGAPGPLQRIDDYPVRQPLGAVPHRVQPFGAHAGHWLGAKGQNLFYAAGRGASLDVGHAAISAVKRSDLLGRTITRDAEAAIGAARA